MKRTLRLSLALLPLAAVSACGTDGHRDGISQVETLVVIYAENRSFDNLYGNFPGARGLNEVVDADGKPTAAYAPQKDRDGHVLASLPPTWNGVTAPGVSPAVSQAQSTGLPNAPFTVETAFRASAGVTLDHSTITRDLVHRFFENQMEIDGGRNDGFAAWSDAGGLALGHFDNGKSRLYALAQQYVLADNFFQGAFGGSYLNHQYLICACAPEYPDADRASQKPGIAAIETDAAGNFKRLSPAPNSPASAMDGPPRFLLTGNIAPASYFGDGRFHSINTMQPPYQPSGNPPVEAKADGLLYADTAKPTTLPAQTATTIGDLLSARTVSWKWYAGAWNEALADGRQPPGAARRAIYAPGTPGAAPDFQPHHQPFNYYKAFDPGTAEGAAARAAHLKDYADLLADIAAGTLPAVAFYKPTGNVNQHEGYASLEEGDRHLAELVAKLQASPQWHSMLIVITYDEFGGAWDHVAPPRADKLGPGTRIPAILISPLSPRNGTVDHTPYDTSSILRFITRRYGLPTLPGLAARDAALKANGEPPMGDLSQALQ
jgi:acid phosphatase